MQGCVASRRCADRVAEQIVHKVDELETRLHEILGQLEGLAAETGAPPAEEADWTGRIGAAEEPMGRTEK